MTDVAEVVHLAVQSGLATITLDSSANRNALSVRLRAELRTALRHAADEKTVRVVVLDHRGPVFCSGMDLTEPGGQGVGEFVGILEQIWNHPKPVVAKLSGPARAGGIGIVAAADVAIAAEGATFAFTETRLGLVPAVISVPVLARLLPREAHSLFLTGETFDAAQAVTVGLLTSAVATDELDAEVARHTGMLVRAAPVALTQTKRLLNRHRAPNFTEDLAAMLALSTESFGSDEGQEGIRAFTEKRPPSWVPDN